MKILGSPLALSTITVSGTPNFSGAATGLTAAVDTNTTQLATTAYVIGQGYLKSATASSTYAPLASPVFTGNPTAPTASVGDNDTSIATTAFVTADFVRLTTAQTVAGIKTFSANPVVDPGTGSAAATITLTGRNGGTASAGTISTTSAVGGPMVLNAAGGSVTLQVAAAERFKADLGGVSIPTGATYQINGTQISTASLSDGANVAHINATETISGAYTFSAIARHSNHVYMSPGTAVGWRNAGDSAFTGYILGDASNVTFTYTAGATAAAYAVSTGNWTFSTNATFTPAAGSGAQNSVFVINPPGHTVTGALATQRAVVISTPSAYTAASAQTVTDAATFAIAGAPSAGANVTITNTYSLWVQGGNSYFQGNVNTTGAFQINGTSIFASPTFTGTPAAPTASTADNSTTIATTAFVKAQGYITSGASTNVANTWTALQTFRDNFFEITDDGDTTKKLNFQVSGVTTATTRTLTVPNASGTVALSDVAQTISGAWNFTTAPNMLSSTWAQGTLTQGRVEIVGGTASQSGYINWFSSGNARLAYLGYDNVNLTMVVENGAGFSVTGGAFAGRTTEQPTFTMGSSQVTFGATVPTTQRYAVFNQAAAITATAAQTITTAATVAITGAPVAGTNVTITNTYALWVQAGNSYFQGNINTTGTVTAPAYGGNPDFTGIVYHQNHIYARLGKEVSFWNPDNTNAAAFYNAGTTNNNDLKLNAALRIESATFATLNLTKTGTGAGTTDIYRDSSFNLNDSGGIYINLSGQADVSILQNNTGTTRTLTLGGTASTLKFFNGTGSTKKTGYGSGSEITTVGTKGALTAASTLEDVIRNFSSLVADLRTYGLVGA